MLVTFAPAAITTEISAISKMSPLSMLFAVVFLQTLSLCSSDVVFVGDAFRVDCASDVHQLQSGQNRSYSPNFDKFHAGVWKDLFTGSSPRPDMGATSDRWDVTENADEEFLYELPHASLEDGGVYRCKGIEEVLHNLTVVSAELDCGVAPKSINQTGFSPVCRMVSSGPDVPEKPVLKWFLGSPSNILRNLSSVVLNERSTEVQLVEENASMMHGHTVTCFMEGIAGNVVKPSCVLGPLEVAFEVKMDSLVESTNGSIMSFEVNLTGNPAPVADLVNFTMSPVASGFVQTKVTPLNSSVVVRVRADLDTLPSITYVEVDYDGRDVATLTFVPTKLLPAQAPTIDSGSSALTSSAVFAVIFIVVCAVVVVILFKLGLVCRKATGSEAASVVEEEEELNEDKELEGMTIDFVLVLVCLTVTLASRSQTKTPTPKKTSRKR